MEKKLKVAFICTHNSCRSQIAEALTKHLASDVLESYSAGTEIKDKINEDAVRLLKEKYAIDMEQSQRPKTLSDIPRPVDIVVTMGCGVACPFFPSKHREDWGLEDPTGKSDEVFSQVIDDIEARILDLKSRLQQPDFFTKPTLTFDLKL
ncbi:MAG TPA: arsenate reductase ArsC [Clostridiaceae bacterium]|nr:arsenate reductase ArsC [Clostridiaceae bacterium]